MNYVFLSALILYLIVFLIIGIMDIKKIRSFTDYSVAGKSQSSFTVVMTLLATVVGASTTIGITDTVYKIGFPGDAPGALSGKEILAPLPKEGK